MESILDIHDAAEFLGIRVWTLYRLAKSGRIPAQKIGGQWRFKKSILDGLVGEPIRRLIEKH